MSRYRNLNKASLNKKYTVKKVAGDNNMFEKYGIFEGSSIVPLFRNMGNNICAYKTDYGIFAIRNETAEKIRVQDGER